MESIVACFVRDGKTYDYSTFPTPNALSGQVTYVEVTDILDKFGLSGDVSRIYAEVWLSIPNGNTLQETTFYLIIHNEIMLQFPLTPHLYTQGTSSFILYSGFIDLQTPFPIDAQDDIRFAVSAVVNGAAPGPFFFVIKGMDATATSRPFVKFLN